MMFWNCPSCDREIEVFDGNHANCMDCQLHWDLEVKFSVKELRWSGPVRHGSLIVWDETEVDVAQKYCPGYGDDKLCECGCSYYRHFDSYEDMAPVGCKYCGSECEGFVEDTGYDCESCGAEKTVTFSMEGGSMCSSCGIEEPCY